MPLMYSALSRAMQLSDSQGEVGTLHEQLMDIMTLRDRERAEHLKMKVRM